MKSSIKRIVVKIGSSSLSHENGHLNLRSIDRVARVLSDLSGAGMDVILVSSGAVSAGRAKLGFTHKPDTIEEKQALAAVGQAELMQIYERFFSDYGRSVAQILITRSTVDNETSKHNAQNTVNKLLSLGCVPIVNENDTVSFEEIEFGDNDTLAAYVAVLADADMLINLSDIDGLYDADPHHNPDAKLIANVPEITDAVRNCAGGSGSEFGTGGVVTKLHAAEIALAHGIPMVLTGGTHPEYIYDIIEGKPVGTFFGGAEKAQTEKALDGAEKAQTEKADKSNY